MYVLAGGSNMDGRANADELTARNLERVRNASARVWLSYIGGFDSEMNMRVSASRYTGPLRPVVPNGVLAEKFRLKRAFGPAALAASDGPTAASTAGAIHPHHISPQ